MKHLLKFMNTLSKIDKVGVVILAAGRGTRLNSTDRPKVMSLAGGRPLVDYTVLTLERLGFSEQQIFLVVGFKKEVIREYFGTRVQYVEQAEQLGTAHAAHVGMKALPQGIETVLVLQGDDTAFYSVETIDKIIHEHLEKKVVLTLLSTYLENPGAMGRVVRHENGRIEIVEKEDLTDEQKKINEISTGTFVYNRAWFEGMFGTMPKLGKLGEYGQPTALAIAASSGQPHQVVTLTNPSEWFGVNTPEELAEADRRKRLV